MDGKVKEYLSQVKSPQEAGLLLEAYQILIAGDKEFDVKKSREMDETLSTELLVLCAEACVTAREFEVGKDCLRRYFDLKPAPSQFLCRAYFVQAEIQCEAPLELSVMSVRDAQNNKLSALENILKGVRIALENSKRYSFLISNSTAIYWKIARSFMRSGLRRALIPTLSSMCVAMDEINMAESDVRCNFLLELAKAYEEAGDEEKSQAALNKANALAKDGQGIFRPEIIEVYSKFEGTSNALDLKDVPQLDIFCKIESLKRSKDFGKTEFLEELEYAKMLLISGGKTELTLHHDIPDAAKVDTKSLEPDPIKPQRSSSPAKASAAAKAPPPPSNLTTTTSLMKGVKVQGLPSEMMYKALFALARIALGKSELSFVAETLEYLEKVDLAWVKIEVEYLSCELSRVQIPPNAIYSKKGIEIRKSLLQRLTNALHFAVFNHFSSLVQGGSALIWNIGLPFLQPNLRSLVKVPFLAATEALESIDSTLSNLSCQFHIELSKCEEDGELLTKAKDHIYKAIQNDIAGEYSSFLETAKRRLDTITAIYEDWDNDLDRAVVMAEQAKESTDLHHCRVMLIRSLSLIAPNGWKFDDMIDALNERLSGQSEQVKENLDGEYPLRYMTKHSRNKFLRFEYLEESRKCKTWEESYADRERALLFAKIAKTARKYEIWDVASPAVHFFLEYSWNPTEARVESRLAAEANFIRAECLIQMLKCHGLKLGEDVPGIDYPVELIEEKAVYARHTASSLVNDGQGEQNDKDQAAEVQTPSEDIVKVLVPPREFTDQELYSIWIRALSSEAIEGLVEGMRVGLQLEENWIVLNAAVYAWNYSLHLIKEKQYVKLLQSFQEIFNGMKEMKVVDTDIFCAVANTLALARIQAAEMVSSLVEEGGEFRSESPDPAAGSKKDKKGEKLEKNAPGKKGDKKADKKTEDKKGDKKQEKKSRGKLTNETLVFGDETPESNLSQGMEVCHFAINSTKPKQKRALISTLVHLMHITSTSYGSIDNNMSKESKVMLFMEAWDYSYKNKIEVQGLVGVSQIADILQKCTDLDPPLQVEFWIKLAMQAFNCQEYNKSIEYSQKALDIYSLESVKLKKKGVPKKIYEIVHTGYKFMGKSKVILAQNPDLEKDQIEQLRKEGLEFFWKATKFAFKAENYDLLNKAAFNIWNVIVPLIRKPSSRALLIKPLEKCLNYLSILGGDVLVKKYNTIIAKEEETKEDAAEKGESEPSSNTSDSTKPVCSDSVTGLKQEYLEEIELRVRLYQVLFECYNDQKMYKDGLGTVESAFSVIPRLFQKSLWQKKILFKCLLGKKIEGDMVNLKHHPEETKAQVWRTVAHSSSDPLDQLKAFQRCITSITSREGQLDKVEYLIEFGEWLYMNDFPKQDSIDQLEKAVDILMDIENKESSDHEEEKILISGSSSASVPHLELLAKVYVMLACVSSTEKISYCIIAQHYYVKILETSFNEAAFVTKYGLSTQPERTVPVGEVLSVEKKGGKGSNAKKEFKGAKGDKKGEKGDSSLEERETKKDDIMFISGKKGTGVMGMPVSYPEWANFEFNEDLKCAFNTPVSAFDSLFGHTEASESLQRLSNYMINKDSINQPEKSIYYLRRLFDMLEENQLHHLAVPILSLLTFLAEDIAKDEIFAMYCRWKFVEVCQVLNLTSAVGFHQSRAGPAKLTEEARQICRSKVRLQKFQNRLIEKKEISPVPFESDPVTKQFVESLAKFGRMPTAGSSTKDAKLEYLEPISERECLLQQAFVIINQGYYEYAYELLYEAQVMALAFQDHEIMGGILFALSKLAFLQNDLTNAVKFIRESRLYKGDSKYWKDSTLCLCNYLIADGKKLGECKSELNATIEVFKRLIEERPNLAHDYYYVLGHLHAKYANILIDEIYILKANDSPWMDEHSLALEQFKASITSFASSCTGLVEKSEIVIDYVSALLQCQKQSFEEQQELLVDIMELLCNQSNELNYYLQEVMPPVSTHKMSLPLQRTYASMEMFIGTLELDIYTNNFKRIDPYGLAIQNPETNEVKQRAVRKVVSSEVERAKIAIARFVAGTPEPDPVVTHWNDIKQSAFNEMLGRLSCALVNAKDDIKLKGKVHFLLGKCLKQMRENDGITDYWPSKEDLCKTPVGEENDAVGSERASPASASQRNSIFGKRRLSTTLKSPEVKGEEDLNEDISLSEEQKVIAPIHFNLASSETECTRLTQEALNHFEECVNILCGSEQEEILASACEEIMECLGTYDPVQTQKYILIYQSALTSIHLKKTRDNAFKFLQGSKERTLTEQQLFLSLQHCNASKNCPTVLLNSEALNRQSPAFKRIAQEPPVTEIMKELPSGLRCVVLQHSRDFKSLYATICHRYDEATTLPHGPVMQIQLAKNSGTGSNTPLVFKCNVDKSSLEELCRDFLRVKFEIQKHVVRKQEYLCAVKKQQEADKLMAEKNEDNLVFSENITEEDDGKTDDKKKGDKQKDDKNNKKDKGGKKDSKPSAKDTAKGKKGEKQVSKENEVSEEDIAQMKTQALLNPDRVDPCLAFRFQNIVERTEAYLNPVLKELCEGLGVPKSSLLGFSSFEQVVRDVVQELKSENSIPEQSQEPCANDGKEENYDYNYNSESSPYSCVILADSTLMSLPLEAISFFKDANVKAISRDFSLHFVHHRLNSYQSQNTMAAVAEDKKAGGKKDKAPPKGGGTKDGGGEMGFDANRWTYILDPQDDSSTLREFMNESCQATFQSVASDHPNCAKWEGIMGSDHIPSPSEWQRLLSSGSGFLFYGVGRMLAHIDPKYVAGVDMSSCQAMVVMDQLETNGSYRRQLAKDLEKPIQVLQLEQPYDSAKLFSLRGVNSVVMNQWASTLSDGSEKFSTLISSIFSDSKTFGQYIFTLRNSEPHSVPVKLKWEFGDKIPSFEEICEKVDKEATGKDPENPKATEVAPKQNEPQSEERVFKEKGASNDEVDTSEKPEETEGNSNVTKTKVIETSGINYLKYNAVVYGLSHVKMK